MNHVYLMERNEKFRLGYTIDLNRRAIQERADKAYILAEILDESTARFLEQSLSASSGVTQLCFKAHGNSYFSQEALDAIWSLVDNKDRAWKVLVENNKLNPDWERTKPVRYGRKEQPKSFADKLFEERYGL